ncbi:MAG: stage sporulation protein, partial [Streptomyces sp.]|nr:stage sporulation protein [Streptomyces sp.]
MSRSVPTVESRLPRRLPRRWRTAVVTVAVAAAAIAGATGLPLAGGGGAARAAVMAAPRAAALVPAESFLPPANGILVFTGHGWGHGIGMSQWGAYGAATQGLTAAQILDFYYPGTTPTPIDPNMRVRLQLTNNGLDMTVAPVAANGVLSFTDVAAGTTIALPTTVNGTPVIAYRAAQSAGSTMLQANWGSGFQPYLPDGTNPLVVSGVARFTTASGIVRLVNPGAATQVDLRGTVDAVQIGGFVRTIETLGMDEMLPSVVGKEMAADWPTAALQAQTVSARSYAAFQVAAHTAQPFDLAIPKDFAYEGIARYDASGATRIAGWDDPRLLAAVHAFPGDVRTSGGQPIFAMFASSSGGFTVARPGMPYLVAKADPYDAVAVNGHHTWKVSVGVDKVAAAYPAIGSLTSIAVGSRDGNGEWGGRILTLTVNGTAGAV